MSRVLTFSRYFPSYHRRRGECTYFVEKIWESIGMPEIKSWQECELVDETLNSIRQGSDVIWPKHHTIRAGHRFKVGDWFSPRVWSGKPYRSKQIIIAPDIQVKKIWDFRIDATDGNYWIGDDCLSFNELKTIATNDGLEIDNFEHWFERRFTGQIISWSDKIEY